MNALSVENLGKSFGPVRAVGSLSAVVPAGCIYGFLGPNGAGKTTTIRMILNIIRPDRGTIDILGHPSAALVRERIGYLPEERGLYRTMTVRGVLAYLGVLKGLRGRQLAVEIPRWLEKVGLSERADKKVEELSRGMQQKLQFVAAAINDPDLLILDEPFSGLDPVNLDLIKGIMLDMRRAGKTIIFSTHMLEQAEQLCDSVLLINGGEKIMDGPLDRIKAKYDFGAVSVEAEGDTGFIEGLPMVKSAVEDGKRVEITLADGSDSVELLKALVARVRIRRFEEKTPSLHEIFIRLVGKKDA